MALRLASVVGDWTDEGPVPILQLSPKHASGAGPPRRAPIFEVIVRRYAHLRRRVRALLVEHFELFLTTVGVLLAITIAFTELTRGEQGLATVTLVWLQGFLIWAVHRHAWFRRRALVTKMRVMLQDRVNNQLTVMLGAAEMRARPSSYEEQADLDRAVGAARTVSEELERLSLESLRDWERRYRRSVPASLS